MTAGVLKAMRKVQPNATAVAAVVVFKFRFRHVGQGVAVGMAKVRRQAVALAHQLFSITIQIKMAWME
jgi:hypothetical protein